ncbi:helix-turn-helix transcriptional regulator [Amycolatopsis viridis]|uniref:DNA-binding transcriptional regulator YafY n=1 Tax=Amycolatopsis viridis TaxID=185678 RepID=A0ABX0SLN9_9PSEU|nr:YafY family protein [Amycolatopsis viridis]NIH77891.1 putative DNA-binding transcriptional regulator YafY [Amycolatopsis viridis]
MRASRLVSALLLLQTRGRMTARQLADELDVSVRTIYRDMDALSAAGIPLYADAGHDGGYQLLDGYRTRLTGLTTDEAEALFLSGLPGAAADLGLGAVLATAQLKLMAALPEELRDRAGQLQQRFHLDTSGWYADPEPTPHLAAVVQATWNQLRVRVKYRRWAAPHEVTRVVEPYGVVLKAGRWYLVGGSSGSVRTYRVSQILRVQPLAERFPRPPGFDLGRHWDSYLEEFDARRYVGEATVRMTTSVFDRLTHLLEPDLARAARERAQPDTAGWIRTVIPIESTDHTAGLLLRLGAEAEVLAPDSLRQRLATTAAALAELYGRPAPPA